ncbi:MAG: helix-turn-helix transcriptional regulator [Bdellovibrionaceae bacterium]|jgi:DNA-binding XRE family transcriptional regulator|nr:helix-turn-helix transcriptional regulator [Pseudobdellovibrionaceae bacterium]
MSTKNLTTRDIEKLYGPLTFGNLLKAHREGDELTQVEMAKKIKLSKQALNDIENGRKIPSISRAVALAKKVGILPELAVELVLQDQLDREKLKMTVKVSSGEKAA